MATQASLIGLVLLMGVEKALHQFLQDGIDGLILAKDDGFILATGKQAAH